MIKVSIHHQDMIILNVYAPKNGDAKYVKQKLLELKGEMVKFTIKLRGSHPPIPIDVTRQKIIKDTEELNTTVNQQDLINC